MSYYQVPTEVERKLINLKSRAERYCFFYLKVHSDYKTHISKPASYEDISDESGISIRHIRTAIYSLQENDWIERVSSRGKYHVWDIKILKAISESTESKPDNVEKIDIPSKDPFQVREYDDQQVMTYEYGGRIYRFNTGKECVESTMLHREHWENNSEFLPENALERLKEQPYVVNMENLAKLTKLLAR